MKQIGIKVASFAFALVIAFTFAACGGGKTPPSDEHQHTVTDWTETVHPTCEGVGSRTGTCTECGKSVTEAVPALGHTWVGEGVPTKFADCTTAGSRPAKCSVCGASGVMELPALGHSWVTIREVKEPDCTEAGEEERRCSRCPTTETVEIPALGHDWEAVFTIDEPTSFDKAGSKSIHCRVCDARKDETEIPMLEEDTPITYEFFVVRANGDAVPIAGMTAEVYEGEEKVQSAAVRNGSCSMLLYPKEYTVRVTGLPEGYTAVQETVTVQPERPVCSFTVKGEVIESPMSASGRYAVGSVMHDFSYTTFSGETITLKGLLAEKKIVVLNFWYVGCSWCRIEFPGMNEAYQLYQDDVAVVAINSAAQGDTETSAKNFFDQQRLTFYGVKETGVLEGCFGVNSYPTTVVIDREGVVCAIHASALVEDTNGDGEYDSGTRPFMNLFERYLKKAQ